jgi:hypothetical protein
MISNRLYRREYRPSHSTGLTDVLIAATAEENGTDLATSNRCHFPMVPKVVVPYDRKYVEAQKTIREAAREKTGLPEELYRLLDIPEMAEA